MKRYLCHKTVEALQIAAIRQHDSDPTTYILYAEWPEGDRVVDAVMVGAAWMQRYKPVLGGYYVRYADGYESFSPKEVFEAGYSEIDHA